MLLAAGASTDPRLKLINPGGGILAENDDGESFNAGVTATLPADGSGGVIEREAYLIATLPVDGMYTLRVYVYSPGDYVITATQE